MTRDILSTLWVRLGTGQILWVRSSSNSGMKYGKKCGSTVYIGVLLNLTRGQLSFSINGENQGTAFSCDDLKQGPFYPAVTLREGCFVEIVKEDIQVSQLFNELN